MERKDMNKPRSMRLRNLHIPSHVLMLAWMLVVLIPVYLLVSNALKTKRAMYENPFGLPSPLTLENFQSVIQDGNFFSYFGNSLFVVCISLFAILLLGSLAGYALAHWRGKASRVI